MTCATNPAQCAAVLVKKYQFGNFVIVEPIATSPKMNQLRSAAEDTQVIENMRLRVSCSSGTPPSPSSHQLSALPFAASSVYKNRI